MPTLHIEHAITDVNTWLQTFNAYTDARRRGGVLNECVSQPVGDPRYIVIDLTFESVSAAEDFRSFLLERVWSSSESAPALVGPPRAVVLQPVADNTEQPPASGQY